MTRAGRGGVLYEADDNMTDDSETDKRFFERLVVSFFQFVAKCKSSRDMIDTPSLAPFFELHKCLSYQLCT